jgi:hypothetical protein
MWGFLARCGWNYADQDWDFLDRLFFLGLALGVAINPIKTVKYFFHSGLSFASGKPPRSPQQWIDVSRKDDTRTLIFVN